MTHHSELLNIIADKINAEYYLEVGIFNPDHNFNKINVKNKISVDPDHNAHAICFTTSDHFFSFNRLIYDLILIDGLHHYEQVKKDIQNAWECLNTGGIIVIHDSNPYSENITHVPRDNREWSGDVYKAVCNIASPKFTIDFDYGCCILRRTKRYLSWNIIPINWEYFDKNRKELLNLVSIAEGLKIINKWEAI